MELFWGKGGSNGRERVVVTTFLSLSPNALTENFAGKKVRTTISLLLLVRRERNLEVVTAAASPFPSSRLFYVVSEEGEGTRNQISLFLPPSLLSS